MKRTDIHYVGFVFMIIMASCDEPEVVQIDDNTFEEIYQQFHGKYQIVQSMSEQAVDIDGDGRKSTDMLAEIPNLSSTNLALRIYNRSFTQLDTIIYLFTQAWSEQIISSRDLANDTTLSPAYAIQGATRTFTLNETRDTLRVVQADADGIDLEQFPLPEEVSVDAVGQIKVVVRKKLFTSDGWQTVKITTLYSRYTMAT
ncbi:MAG: hypothetical protein RIG62_26530 [Cyclobacteriaceae bacterium]